MKYFNIKLLGKNNLYFIKYAEDRRVEFDKVCKLDKVISDSIIDNNISSFGYMIFHGMYHAIGMIKIDVEDCLNVKITYLDNVDENTRKIYNEDIYISLCRLCPFYKYITINGHKLENKFNSINDLLVDEVVQLYDSLTSKNIPFDESYVNNNYVESNVSKKNLNKRVYKDLFIEVDKLSLDNIISNHNRSNVSFNYDGDVSFETLGSSKNGNYSLSTNYNVDQSYLNISCIRNNGIETEIIDINETEDMLSYSVNNTKVIENKKNGSCKYITSKTCDDNKRLNFELEISSDKKVNYCYLDINLLKNLNYKIKGSYVLRIKDNKFVLYYNFRKGTKEEILSLVVDHEITIDDLYLLIERALLEIAKKEHLTNVEIKLEEFGLLKDKINDFIKSLIGRLPLKVLDEMISKNSKNINKQKKL